MMLREKSKSKLLSPASSGSDSKPTTIHMSDLHIGASPGSGSGSGSGSGPGANRNVFALKKFALRKQQTSAATDDDLSQVTPVGSGSTTSPSTSATSPHHQQSLLESLHNPLVHQQHMQSTFDLSKSFQRVHYDGGAKTVQTTVDNVFVAGAKHISSSAYYSPSGPTSLGVRNLVLEFSNMLMGSNDPQALFALTHFHVLGMRAPLNCGFVWVTDTNPSTNLDDYTMYNSWDRARYEEALTLQSHGGTAGGGSSSSSSSSDVHNKVPLPTLFFQAWGKSNGGIHDECLVAASRPTTGRFLLIKFLDPEFASWYEKQSQQHPQLQQPFRRINHHHHSGTQSNEADPDHRLHIARITIIGIPVLRSKSLALSGNFPVTSTLDFLTGPAHFQSSCFSFDLSESAVVPCGAVVRASYSGPSPSGACITRVAVAGPMFNSLQPVKYGVLALGGLSAPDSILAKFESVKNESDVVRIVDDHNLEDFVLSKPSSFASDPVVDLNDSYRLVFFRTNQRFVNNVRTTWFDRSFRSIRNVRHIAVKFFRPYGSNTFMDVGKIALFGCHELSPNMDPSFAADTLRSMSCPLFQTLDAPRFLTAPALKLNTSLSSLADTDTLLSSVPSKSVDIVLDAPLSGVTLTHFYSESSNVGLVAWIVKEGDALGEANALPGGPMPEDCFLDAYSALSVQFRRSPDIISFPLDHGCLVPMPASTVARRIHIRIVVPREGKSSGSSGSRTRVGKVGFFGVGRPLAPERLRSVSLHDIAKHVEQPLFLRVRDSYSIMEDCFTTSERLARVKQGLLRNESGLVSPVVTINMYLNKVLRSFDLDAEDVISLFSGFATIDVSTQNFKGENLFARCLAEGDFNGLELVVQLGKAVNNASLMKAANASTPDGSTVLIQAVKRNSWKVVSLLLESGAEVKKTTKDGNNALLQYLQLPTNERDPRILHALLTTLKTRQDRFYDSSKPAGETSVAAYINRSRDPIHSFTPLMLAAAYGDVVGAQMLYQAGADTTESWPMTPIMAAVASMDYVIQRGTTLASFCRTIRFLKETCRVDPNFEDSRGRSAVTLCFEFLNLKDEIVVLETLLSIGADVTVVDEHSATSLVRAIRTITDGDLLLNTVRVLCSSEDDAAESSVDGSGSSMSDMINWEDYATGDTAIMLVLSKQFESNLIDSFVHEHKQGQAEDDGQPLDMNAKMNNKFRLSILSHMLRVKAVSLMTSRPMRSGEDSRISELQAGRTPLMQAVLTRDPKIVAFLLTCRKTNPFDINMRDAFGRTALLFAVESGSAEIVALLVSENADPSGAVVQQPKKWYLRNRELYSVTRFGQYRETHDSQTVTFETHSAFEIGLSNEAVFSELMRFKTPILMKHLRKEWLLKAVATAPAAVVTLLDTSMTAPQAPGQYATMDFIRCRMTSHVNEVPPKTSSEIQKSNRGSAMIDEVHSMQSFEESDDKDFFKDYLSDKVVAAGGGSSKQGGRGDDTADDDHDDNGDGDDDDDDDDDDDSLGSGQPSEEVLHKRAAGKMAKLCAKHYSKPEMYDASFPTRFLNRMAKARQHELLEHPIVREWMRVKWLRYQWLYYLDMLQYLVFLFILTLYCLLSNLGLGVILTLLALMRLTFEAYSVYRFRMKYLNDWSNLLSWFLYISCPVVGFKGASIEDQPQLASTLLVIAWFNLIMMARSFEFWDIGINIMMFIVVLKNMIKVLAIAATLLIGMTLAIFVTQSSIANADDVRSFFQMSFLGFFGDGDFYNVVMGQSSESYSKLLVVIYQLAVPLVLMNYLVGLAVGDIESIRGNAEIEKLSKRVAVIKFWEDTGFLATEIPSNHYISYDDFMRRAVKAQQKAGQADKTDVETINADLESIKVELRALQDRHQRSHDFMRDSMLRLKRQSEEQYLALRNAETNVPKAIGGVGGSESSA